MIDIKYKLLLVAFLCFVAPAINLAQGPPQVLISEVAWMGTDQDSSFEWIELYNISGSPIDLTGWTITTESGQVSISLSGVLTVHGVGLVERATDDAVPGVTALLTYSGELADSGDILTLKNQDGTIMDQADGGTDWLGIGGSNAVPKKTAQRTRRGTWVTAAPTPGPAIENAQVSDPLPDKSETGTTTQLSTESGGTDKKSSGGESSGRSRFEVNIIAPATVYVGKPTKFLAAPSGVRMTKIKLVEYNWNFGDAEISEETEPTHSFLFPGNYVVMVEASSSNKQVFARHDIEVLPHPVSLSEAETGDITINNISDVELILDDYKLAADNSEFVFPKNSFLKSGAGITLSHSKIGRTTKVVMRDLDDFVIGTLYTNKNSTVANNLTTNYLSKTITPVPLTGTRSTTKVSSSTTSLGVSVYKITTASADNDKFGFATKNNFATPPKVTDEDKSKSTAENSANQDRQSVISSENPFINILNRIAYFLGIS